MAIFLLKSVFKKGLITVHRYFQSVMMINQTDHRLSLVIFIADFKQPKNGRHRSRVATGKATTFLQLVDADIAMAGDLKVDIDKVFAAAD